MDGAAQDPGTPGAQASIARPRDAFLAGLQAGMLGVLWMLAWMGLCAMWLRRDFWAPENLLASLFHPADNIATEFGARTISGLALYLLIYSLLGGVFAAVAGTHPMRPARRVLLAILTGLGWYYFTFHLLWRTISPPVAFLNAEPPAVLGHLIYGLVLGRFHTYLPNSEKTVTEVVAPDDAAPRAEPAAPFGHGSD